MQNDYNFNDNLYRDCGSGTKVNGMFLQTFCDSYTTTVGVIASDPNTLTSFSRNTMAYFGIDNPNDPLSITQFGGFPDAMNGTNTFQNTDGGIEMQQNETMRVAVWPWGAFAVMPGDKSILGSYAVSSPNGAIPFYNTLVEITAASPYEPPTGIAGNLPSKRHVYQLFYGNEIQFGDFAVQILNDTLYLWGKSEPGLKLARVPLADLAERSKYQYWVGEQWVDEMPISNSTDGLVIPFQTEALGQTLTVSSGGIFWSAHFNTYLAIIMDDGISGQFWIQYSKSQTILGPWSDKQTLYQAPVEPACDLPGVMNHWYYSGFAWPDWDESGRTLLLGWSACGPYTEMAQITFGDVPDSAKIVGPDYDHANFGHYSR